MNVSPVSKINVAVMEQDWSTVAKLIHQTYKSFSINLKVEEDNTLMHLYEESREVFAISNMSFINCNKLKKEIRKLKIKELA